MDGAFDKVNSSSLTESVVHVLLGKILSGDLKAGDWLLPEREIAKEMGSAAAACTWVC